VERYGSLPLHKAVQASRHTGGRAGRRPGAGRRPVRLSSSGPGVVTGRRRWTGAQTALRRAVVTTGRRGLDPLDPVARSKLGSMPARTTTGRSPSTGSVRVLIERMNPEAARAATNEGFTPLHVVAWQRNGDSCAGGADILVQHAPKSFRARTTDGRLPLHCAAAVGPLALVQFLSGCWPGLLRSVTRGGRTPLHCASESQPTGALRYLADMWPRALEMACAQGGTMWRCERYSN
jgi:hypothetical protein